jgi:hypothetical protein
LVDLELALIAGAARRMPYGVARVLEHARRAHPSQTSMSGALVDLVSKHRDSNVTARYILDFLFQQRAAYQVPVSVRAYLRHGPIFQRNCSLLCVLCSHLEGLFAKQEHVATDLFLHLLPFLSPWNVKLALFGAAGCSNIFAHELFGKEQPQQLQHGSGKSSNKLPYLEALTKYHSFLNRLMRVKAEAWGDNVELVHEWLVLSLQLSSLSSSSSSSSSSEVPSSRYNFYLVSTRNIMRHSCVRSSWPGSRDADGRKYWLDPSDAMKSCVKYGFYEGAVQCAAMYLCALPCWREVQGLLERLAQVPAQLHELAAMSHQSEEEGPSSYTSRASSPAGGADFAGARLDSFRPLQFTKTCNQCLSSQYIEELLLSCLRVLGASVVDGVTSKQQQQQQHSRQTTANILLLGEVACLLWKVCVLTESRVLFCDECGCSTGRSTSTNTSTISAEAAREIHTRCVARFVGAFDLPILEEYLQQLREAEQTDLAVESLFGELVQQHGWNVALSLSSKGVFHGLYFPLSFYQQLD